jgi:hypothetical protein
MTRLPLYHWVLGYISQARSWIRFQWISRPGNERTLFAVLKHLLDRLSERYSCDVVSVEVYPVRYVNTTDLPRVETWNCYKTARSCDPPTVCKYNSKHALPTVKRPSKTDMCKPFVRFGIAETLWSRIVSRYNSLPIIKRVVNQRQRLFRCVRYSLNI